MSARVLHLFSLPMLALLLALPARAHAALLDADDSTENCNHNDDRSTPDPNQAPLFAPLPADTDSPTHFSATRPVPAAANEPHAASVAVCRANLHVIPSPDADVHLAITLGKPLPGGALAARLVHRFAFTSTGEHPGLQLEIDSPPGISPRVELSLPMGTATDLALVRGDLDLARLLGDAHIAIVKGNATVHLANSDFRTLECATVMGGIRDRRPTSQGSHGHILGTWSTTGTGSAKVQFSAVAGDLILLPRAS